MIGHIEITIDRTADELDFQFPRDHLVANAAQRFGFYGLAFHG